MIERPAHYDLPYFLSSNREISSREHKVCVIDKTNKTWNPRRDETAKFIVRACNSHYQLIDAVEQAKIQLAGLGYAETVEILERALEAARKNY